MSQQQLQLGDNDYCWVLNKITGKIDNVEVLIAPLPTQRTKRFTIFSLLLPGRVRVSLLLTLTRKLSPKTMVSKFNKK
jgi:hypothetical protein